MKWVAPNEEPRLPTACIKQLQQGRQPQPADEVAVGKSTGVRPDSLSVVHVYPDLVYFAALVGFTAASSAAFFCSRLVSTSMYEVHAIDCDSGIEINGSDRAIASSPV